jgi:peptidoglycan/LPS O-acetylase OafA/YrhL
VVAFDFWRVVGVGLVILVHLMQRYGMAAGGKFGIPGLYYVTLGGLGVTLLIILSGAALEYTYGAVRQRLGTFMWRRGSHIYPTYWAAILLTVGVFGRIPPAPHSLFDWLLDATGFLEFAGRTWQSFVLPTGWFVGVIMALYLVYPWLSKAIRSRPALTLLGMLVVSVASRYLAWRFIPGTEPSEWFPPARAFEFAFGIWLVTRGSALQALERPFAHLPGALKKTLQHLSDLSFPAYLIHWSVINWPAISGLHAARFLAVVVVVTYVASELILFVGGHAQRYLRKMGSPATAPISS